jgi:hypothetical protein
MLPHYHVIGYQPGGRRDGPRDEECGPRQPCRRRSQNRGNPYQKRKQAKRSCFRPFGQPWLDGEQHADPTEQHKKTRRAIPLESGSQRVMRCWLIVTFSVRARRGTRTPANTFLKRSHECERGTHECVRHNGRPPLTDGLQAGPPRVQNRITPLISTKRGEAAVPGTNAPSRLVGGATSAMVVPNSAGLEMSLKGLSKLG